jgi:hypothetical protein
MTRSLFSTRMAPGARMAFAKGSGVRNVELNFGQAQEQNDALLAVDSPEGEFEDIEQGNIL